MLQGLRRGIITLPKATKSFKNMNGLNIVSRSMVELATKEQGEEAIYIRRVENERKKVLEEKMAEILQRGQNDEEKQALVKLLESTEKKS